VRDADNGADDALLGQVESGIKREIQTIADLSIFASQYPYYK
jgi:hypothetical protein